MMIILKVEEQVRIALMLDKVMMHLWPFVNYFRITVLERL